MTKPPDSDPGEEVKDIFSELFAPSDDDIRREIVRELLSTDNLDRKTHLKKPVTWAALTILEEMLDRAHLPESSSVINRFTELAFRYLISKDRLSREEYVRALNAFGVSMDERQHQGQQYTRGV